MRFKFLGNLLKKMAKRKAAKAKKTARQGVQRTKEQMFADFVKRGASVNGFSQLCSKMGLTNPEAIFRQRYIKLRKNEKLQEWVENAKTNAELKEEPFDAAETWAKIITKSLEKKPPTKKK